MNRAARVVAAVVPALLLVATLAPRFDRRDPGPLAHVVGQAGGGSSQGDAIHYAAMVRAFRHESLPAPVPMPFQGRPLAPFLASLLPVRDPMTALDLLNAGWLVATLFMVTAFLGKLGFRRRERMAGALLFSVSFPVFYYGATGLVDPAALAFLALGLLGLADRRWWLVCAAGLAGALAKESALLLVPVSWSWVRAHRGPAWRVAGAVLVATALPLVAIRVAHADAGSYYWLPGIAWLRGNLRPRAFLSVLLSLGLPGLLALAALLRRALPTGPPAPAALRSGLGWSLAGVLYALLSAHLDGRHAWPATLFAIPLGLHALPGWPGRLGGRGSSAFRPRPRVLSSRATARSGRR